MAKVEVVIENMIKTTNQHINFWKRRQIDWKQAYFDTWSHPHRALIIEKLKRIKWGSLLEVGCASGPNLYRIHTEFPRAQLGGMDVNVDAIKLAKQLMPFVVNLEVSNGKEVFYSDKSTDVVLTDMTLIYVSPFEIKNMLREIKRVARNNIILCEFHSTSFFKRLFLAFAGYYAHDYIKLLTESDFYDIQLEKITEKMWPGGEPQRSFGYIITART